MEVILSTNNVFVKKSEVLMDSCSVRGQPGNGTSAREMLADTVCVSLCVRLCVLMDGCQNCGVSVKVLYIQHFVSQRMAKKVQYPC